jgi:conjugative transfer pilus assembly protein TraH
MVHQLRAFLFACLFSISTLSHAGLENQLNAIFDNMSNTTQPGLYNGQNRGVFSGGNFQMRNKSTDLKPFSFTPLSYKAGCGGISLYGGSFSFANTDQYIQLLRNVASNASGYFFDLALGQMCKECSSIMNKINSFMAKISLENQNSCQLAQGIALDVADAFGQKKTFAKRNNLVNHNGFTSDMLAIKEQIFGPSATETLKTDASPEVKKEAELTGNIVWEQIKTQNFNLWFPTNDDGAAQETQFYEEVLSITGTYIITQTDTAEKKDNESGDSRGPRPSILGLRDLALGGKEGIKFYKCDEKFECLDPKPSPVARVISGIREKLQEALLGGTNGLLAKYQSNTQGATPLQRSISVNLGSAGAAFRNLAVLRSSDARTFIENHLDSLSITFTKNILDEVINATEVAMISSKSVFKEEALKQIRQARKKLSADYRALIMVHGSTFDAVEKYNAIIKNMRLRKYIGNTTKTKPQQ